VLGTVDDAVLVGLARRGSQLAWNELVRRFGGLIAALARHHRLSDSDAADVAQQTWMQLHRHIAELRQPEKVAGWLATTARHECLRVIASHREQPIDPVSVDTWPMPGSDPLNEVLRLEREQVVRTAVHQLPEGPRRLLELLTWEERSYVYVSQAMSITIGSVGPIRGRTLRRLARQPELAALGVDARTTA
jgi:RNA polymerase sigma factor (sigma-70 family)